VVRVQLEPTLPGPAVVNATVPRGEDFVPLAWLSFTVALIVDVPPPAAILVGLADTAVRVVLVVIVTVADVALELAVWMLSEAVYDADIEAGLPAVVVADV
jgi:hypothetical protein